jgi:hypothetical protein
MVIAGSVCLLSVFGLFAFGLVYLWVSTAWKARRALDRAIRD